ncbi:MAG: hypothetical protein Q8859_02780, partial [Bacteroidota bacterium]|nr:hypothetical protein [Bacteroidota bacterium]
MIFSCALKRGVISLAFITFICCLSLKSFAKEGEILIGGRQTGWQAFINAKTGTIVSYQTYQDGKWNAIDFRKDSYAGPAWKGVVLSLKDEKKVLFEGSKDNVTYSLQYLVQKGHLTVRAGIKNQTDKTISPLPARLIIGINSEMRTYPEWDNRFFPTLLRCEKTHLWGYFMTPKKRIFAIGVSEPVASYTMNYICEGSFEWNSGHQIFTASLDLLHEGPLPTRHPQNLSTLKPLEYKKWDIHLGEVNTLEKVKSVISGWLNAPMIEADRYTIEKGKDARLTINSSNKIEANIETPSGEKKTLAVQRKAGNTYLIDLKSKLLNDVGLYTIRITDPVSKKISEASVYLREPFSWYMKMARDNAYTKKPIISGSAESSYGFYAAFLARKYFPDSTKDLFLENLFNQKIGLAFDLKQGRPLPDVSPKRVQNITTTIGILTDLWEATQDTTYLSDAAKLGDYIASPDIQKEDGSYRSGNTHYTAVIYPAKSMLELATAEKQLAKDNN